MRLLQGIVLGILLTILISNLFETASAQDSSIQMFGMLSGVPKMITVDVNGNLNVKGN